jgi:hypothetical protein
MDPKDRMAARFAVAGIVISATLIIVGLLGIVGTGMMIIAHGSYRQQTVVKRVPLPVNQ